jgi:hypothetical protein
VTEFIPDSPSVARAYCPGCEPEADPSVEILDLRWCQTHLPGSQGLDDATVRVENFLSGSVEAGGDDNRRWCELLHGETSRSFRVLRRPAAGRARPIAP